MRPQRSTGARVALSVLAVPLFLTGIFTGAFASALVAAGGPAITFPAADRVVGWRSSALPS